MKHQLSKTLGTKYWLAKALNKPSFLCPDISTHLKSNTYSFSLADFDPRNLTIEEARQAGKRKSLDDQYGVLFGAQVWRMAHETNIGDIVYLETQNKNLHAWGEIISNYSVKPLGTQTEFELQKQGLHIIGVEWHTVVGGDNLFKIDKRNNLFLREITTTDYPYDIIQKFLKLNETVKPIEDSIETQPNDLEYQEGTKRLKTHLVSERSKTVVKLAKELARIKTGKLICEACNCVPEEVYNNLDIIEAHHLVEISAGIRQTKVTDFIMLCPSCHRAVHKLMNTEIANSEALKLIKSYSKKK